MEVTLSNEEKELLIEILQERRDTFLREISRADSHDFKDLLRKKELLVEALLEKARADTRFPTQIRDVA
jgi:stage III sporulation protein SpoIIIAA